MSYTLAGSVIRRPTSMKENNSTQFAQNRPLGGGYTRDYFGSNKRIWTLSYEKLNATDYQTIYNLYQTFLSTKAPVSFVIDEGNYSVNTSVLIDFPERDFSIPGSSYLSNNTLTLTEV